MSDEKDPGGVRRFGERDRKQKLERPKLEFGPLTPNPPPAPSLPPEAPLTFAPPDEPAPLELEAVEEAPPDESDVLPFEFEYPPEWRAKKPDPQPDIESDEDQPAPEPGAFAELEAEQPEDAGAAPDHAVESLVGISEAALAAADEPDEADDFDFDDHYVAEADSGYDPEADLPGLDSAQMNLSDAALMAMLSQAERQRAPDPLDRDAEALLDEIEDDTAALQAITPDEQAAYRARQSGGDRFPPLPGEQSGSSKAKAKAPPRPAAPPPPRKRGPTCLYNLLALGFAAAGCGVIAAFVAIWSNPYSSLNPRPPLTPMPIVISQTPTPSLTPVPTDSPTPSETPTPSDTPTPSLTPTETPVPGTPTPFYSFVVPVTLGSQQVYITNPEQRGACQWSSLAGSVADINGEALNGYQIRVLGEGVDETLISGSATGFGPGGFELPLGFEARDAQFAVQLLDPNGTPVSNVYNITTSSRCDWNISVVRFQQQPGP